MQVFYTVRSGDTLSSIAAKWNLPVETLIAANNIIDPKLIYIGEQLSIPPIGKLVRFEVGDTLNSIARKYGVPSELIIEANQLRPPYRINIDRLLKIPAGVKYYRVKKGDSLLELAYRYNVVSKGKARPELIERANNLTTSLIPPGLKLVIPYANPGGGGKIAYVRLEGLSYSIWLYDPDLGTNKKLVADLAEQFSTLYWSPNSKRIAFMGKAHILYIVNVLTGRIRKIDTTEPASFISWSPDSTKIAYPKENKIVIYDLLKNRVLRIRQPNVTDINWFPNGDELLFQATEPFRDSQLYSIRIDGTEKTQLTQNEEGPLNNVRLSPDGNFVVYTTPGASISNIYTLDLRREVHYQIRTGPLAKDYNPVWSPDSRKIAYSSTNYDHIYYSKIRISGRLGEFNRFLSRSNCFATPVSWSPQGHKIAYLSGCDDSGVFKDMWVVDLNHPAPILALRELKIYNLSWSYC